MQIQLWCLVSQVYNKDERERESERESAQTKTRNTNIVLVEAGKFLKAISWIMSELCGSLCMYLYDGWIDG